MRLLRLGTWAIAVSAFVTLGACAKTAPGGSSISEVARGDSHELAPNSRSMLARSLVSGRRADDGFDAILSGHTREGCPANMAGVDMRGHHFCIDRYEAALIEVLPNGDERPYDSFSLAEGHIVRAISTRGVFPHGYVSEVQAKDACARSGKRLCKADEWRQACMGPQHATFGYGNDRVSGRCNDHGVSPMITVMQLRVDHPREWTHDRMNDPRLNQASNTLARTGDHESCTNGYGVYDMVGNLHEWVDDPEGTFQGGYYLDTHLNGDGCTYRTTAHGPGYHDYSTGFRCCADAR